MDIPLSLSFWTCLHGYEEDVALHLILHPSNWGIYFLSTPLIFNNLEVWCKKHYFLITKPLLSVGDKDISSLRVYMSHHR